MGVSGICISKTAGQIGQNRVLGQLYGRQDGNLSLESISDFLFVHLYMYQFLALL